MILFQLSIEWVYGLIKVYDYKTFMNHSNVD